MNKAHQKELQKNDLEMGLEKVASTVRPYYLPIAVGVVILAVGLIGYTVYERNNQASNAAAWTKWSNSVFDRDTNAEDLRQVATDLGDTPASHWALQLAADKNLEEGSMLIFSERELAEDKLKVALELYEKVIAEAAKDPMLVTRARYGAARTSECLFKVDAAIEFYQQIVDSPMGMSALGKAAVDKIEQLKKPETKDWYKWYATTEPPKPVLNSPGRSGLGAMPELPKFPDIDIPGLTDPVTPPKSEKDSNPPKGDEKNPLDLPETPPAEREVKPSRFEEKPSEEKPAESSTEKPAQDPPAEPPPADPNPK
jgi:hypothetical protein